MYVETHTHVLAFLLTYLLTPWGRVLLEKLTGFQLVKKSPAFYGTQRFITAFTSARHLPLSWAVWTFLNNIHFYGESLLAPRPNPKLEDHSLSAVRDYLLNIFAATLLIRGLSSTRKLSTRHTVVIAPPPHTHTHTDTNTLDAFLYESRGWLLILSSS